MSRLMVQPIVEGRGEFHCVRILIQRIWNELLRGEYVEVLKPILVSRSKVIKTQELNRAVNLAFNKLRCATTHADYRLALLLLDADTDLPCVLAPRLLSEVEYVPEGVHFSVVLARSEYETWFVAAASSLQEFLDLGPETEVPTQPELGNAGKGWVQRRFRKIKYTEPVDQPKMTARMDLTLCRERCPSFDKLCREFEIYMAKSS